MALAAILVDTNVLLRIVFRETEQDEALLNATYNYSAEGLTLCITLQNLAEFWNVATRPRKHNGFGRTIIQVAAQADDIISRFKLLPETQETVIRWRKLVEEYAITGVLVHDTRLAAIMQEYGISQILTLNARDFARFPFVVTIDPRETR